MLKTVTLTAKTCDNPEFDNDYFCTVEINKDACKGDGGAGLIDKDNVIYGVVSGGRSCLDLFTSAENHQDEGRPLKEWEGGQFTAISWHLGFICEIIDMVIKGCPETFKTEKYLTLS
uniref:Peptidase S1 domain-containing protein n=1 Tax=Panagrolaimus davidi TaxID=227884 RepID=A0A914QQH9_9BILA